MNRGQRICLGIGIVLVVLSGLFPKWRMVYTNSGRTATLMHSFLLAPPHYRHRIYAEPEDIIQYEDAKKTLHDEAYVMYAETYKDVIKQFELRYGRPNGQIHDGTWWWRTEAWDTVEPQLDYMQFYAQLVLVVLFTGGLVLLLRDSPKRNSLQ